jgi:hypothetical protein
MIDLSGIQVGDIVILRDEVDDPDFFEPIAISEINPGFDGKEVLVGTRWYSEDPPSYYEFSWWKATGENVVADLQGHQYDIVAWHKGGT